MVVFLEVHRVPSSRNFDVLHIYDFVRAWSDYFYIFVRSEEKIKPYPMEMSSSGDLVFDLSKSMIESNGFGFNGEKEKLTQSNGFKPER